MPQTKKQRIGEGMSEKSSSLSNEDSNSNQAAEEGMQRYLLVHEYVGQAFCGWQRQPKGITTVQSVLEVGFENTLAESPPPLRILKY